MSRLTRAAAGLYDRLVTGAAKAALRSLTKGSAGEARLAQLLGPYFTQSPGAWSGDRTLQVLAHRHWVFVAVNAIAQTLAEETPICASVRGPLDLQRQMATAKFLKLPISSWRGNYMTAWDRKKALTPTRPEEELEVHGSGHKLVDLLEHPNEEDTGSALWEEFGQFLELTGEAYLWKVRNGAGRVSELWVIPSNWVWPIGLGKTNIIDFYEVRPWGSGGSMPQGGVRFSTDEIIAVRFKSPWSKIRGGSVTQAGSVMIDVYDSIQTCRYNSMKNGVNVGSFFQLPADMEADEQKIRQSEARMMEKLGGEKGFRMPVVLPPGVTLNRPPAPYEMDFIQSSDQARDQILSLFGVPYPVAMIVGGATYENADAAWRGFYRRTMRRRFRLLGQALTKDLAPEFGDDLRVFYKDPSLDAPEQVNADIETDFRCMAISPNQICAIRGREPFDDPRMDMPWGPMTLAPFGIGVGEDDLGAGAELSHTGRPETDGMEGEDEEGEGKDKPAGGNGNGGHGDDKPDAGGDGGDIFDGLGLPRPKGLRRIKAGSATNGTSGTH